MLHEAILVKTAKGVDELAKRTHGLPARQRTLLILVDGRTPAAALVQKALSLGHAEGVFEELAAQGFISTEGGDAESAPVTQLPASTLSPVPAATPAIAPASRRSLALARLHLTESVGRMYGKHADALRDALRNATTREALLQQLEHCVDIVTESSGPARGAALRQRVMELMPDS